MGNATFSPCDSEPIRTPGAIQPHGVLLILDNDADLKVVAVSKNCATFLGVSPELVLGQSACSLLGHAVLEKAHSLRKDDNPIHFMADINGVWFDCQCYANNDKWLCVDIEFAAQESSRQFLQIAQSGLASLRVMTEVDAIVRAAAEQVKTITRFDRVMIYRFDSDWNGAVIAEASCSSAESYLGLNFPASDIPSQARDLYLTSLVRHIPDATYLPVVLITDGSIAEDTIDLGKSQLRSVSPMHLEYMQNMGVRASLVGSLIIDGRLWGLVTCHQWKEAKVVSRAEREIFAWVCGDLSSVISGALSYQLLAEKKRRALEREHLLSAVYKYGLAGLMGGATHEDLLSIMHADGFALVTGTGVNSIGDSPSPERVLAMLARYRDLNGGKSVGLFCSNRLNVALGLEASDDNCAGVLILSLKHRPDVYMLWFRQERIHEVFWGGDPSQPHAQDEGYLSPRKSFATFRQIIHGQSRPWSEEETEAARHLGSLIEIEVQRGYKHQLDRSETIYRSVVNAMAEGMVAQDPSGKIIASNKRAEEILGLTKEQMSGRTSLDPSWKAIHEDGSDFLGNEHPAMVTLRTGQPKYNIVMGVHKPDCRLTWISINSEPMILDGKTELHGVVTTFLDITEKKRIQTEDLAAKIFSVQEAERARLSHDLHDEIGQALTALKIALVRTQQGCKKAAEKHCFLEAQEITQQLMEDVRIMGHQLRPSELDELGLTAALRSHIDKIILPVDLSINFYENLGEQRLPSSMELCCFRVVQEALTNCLRHSQARKAKVLILLTHDALTLSITDDGIGFTHTTPAGPGLGSLGLIGMRERVTATEGRFDIRTKEGLGTEVFASWPLEKVLL